MSPAPAPAQLWARYGLCPALGALDGVLLTQSNGRIQRIAETPFPPADLPSDCIYEEHILTPGLLNAHCHLDYSYLKGQLPRGQGFAPWLRAMIEERRANKSPSLNAVNKNARAGIQDLCKGGATEVWDINALGLELAPEIVKGLHRVLFLEIVAPTPESWKHLESRNAQELRKVKPFFGSSEMKAGISPHSLYSVCTPALEALSEKFALCGTYISIHLAESPEESMLLQEGKGTLAAVLNEINVHPEISSLSPIARARSFDLLSPRTLAIHCNCPQSEDAEILAKSMAVVVFCPGAHRFFGYPEYPWNEYRKAGVRLALGTDSLASADSLSMHDAARRLDVLQPEMSPLEVLAVATGEALGDTPPYGGRGLLGQPSALGIPAAVRQPAKSGSPHDGEGITQTGGTWALWHCPNLPPKPDENDLGEAWLDSTTTLVRSSCYDGS